MKRKNRLDIRVTDDEKAMITHCASCLGMTQTDVIMQGVKIVNGLIEKHREGREHDKRGRDQGSQSNQ